jgi:hypothetical protein
LCANFEEIYFRSSPFASKRVLLSESLKRVFNNILSLLASLNANVPVCKTPKLVQLFSAFPSISFLLLQGAIQDLQLQGCLGALGCAF